MRQILFLLSLCLFSAAAAAGPAPSHLLIQVSLEKGSFTLVRVTEVAQPLPKQRTPSEPGTWKAALLDEKGRPLYSVRMNDPTELRGEFEDPTQPGRIQAVHTRQPEPVHFTVRVPAGAGRRLVFYALDAERVREPEPKEADWKTLGDVRLTGKE
ncbi:MAG: hypothetical protein GYA21_00400 [Myxococcales bacterium]|nr:hypothetical protein [Myxococcales bacterium]